MTRLASVTKCNATFKICHFVDETVTFYDLKNALQLINDPSTIMYNPSTKNFEDLKRTNKGSLRLDDPVSAIFS